MIRVAIVQMSSTNDLETNLRFMEQHVKEASRNKASLVAFPELSYFLGRKKEWLPLINRYESLKRQFSQWAGENNIYLVPGTLREPVPHDPERYFNTLSVFDPTGKEIAKYRKLFLFRASLPDLHYDEAKYSEPGTELSSAPFLETRLGLAVCFDLRFPELFRSLRKRGCFIVLLPTSFTESTGKVHWDVLTRTRAIENLFFLAAPCQVGTVGDGETKHGHSRVISPWGDVLAELKQEPGIIYCNIDLEEVSAAEKRLNAWSARNERLFPIT